MAQAGTIGPVVFPFTGYGTGGSHISTFQLARALAADGVETIVLALAGSTVEAEARKRGLAVRSYEGLPKRRLLEWRDVAGFAARRSLLRKHGPGTIVHCSDIWSIAAWGLPGKAAGLPLVYHNRTLSRGSRAERAMVALADAVICISRCCRDALRGARRGVEVTEILNPFEDRGAAIDRGQARAEFEARWPVPGLELIGVSGNLEHRKRQDFFLDAAAHTARLRPNARFILFGRDRQLTAAGLGGRAEALGIADKVMFAGFRSPPERNLKALDVLAAPALAEPFGRTLIEALLVDTPYVATDDAGHHEIHGRFGGGVAVPREASAEAFGAAMAAVAAEPARYRLDAPAHAAAVQAVDPATHAAAVLAVYRRMLDRLGKGKG